MESLLCECLAVAWSGKLGVLTCALSLCSARNNVIYSSSVRAVAAIDDGEGGSAAAAAPAAASHVDGEPISLSEREMGSVELFPQTVVHNANGRFLVVAGDNEYVIYTAQVSSQR